MGMHAAVTGLARRACCVLAGVAMLLAMPATPAWAGLPETPLPRQLSVADGLPSNTVYDVAEDADGYLWFATLD